MLETMNKLRRTLFPRQTFEPQCNANQGELPPEEEMSKQQRRCRSLCGGIGLLHAEIERTKREICLEHKDGETAFATTTRQLLTRARDLRYKAGLLRAELERSPEAAKDGRDAKADNRLVTKWTAQAVKKQARSLLSHGQFASEEQRAIFERAADNLLADDSETRCQAVKTIQGLRKPESVYLLHAALAVDDNALRADCLRALAELGAPCTRAVFDSYAGHKHHRVRLAALSGLHSLGGDTVVQVCLRGLADWHPEVRKMAATFLGWRRARRLAPTMTFLLGDEDVEVRLAAVRALGELRSEETVSALICALKDESTPVRCGAKHVLEEAFAIPIVSNIDENARVLAREVESLLRWWGEERLARACGGGKLP